jgi:molecular chaperone GrpE
MEISDIVLTHLDKVYSRSMDEEIKSTVPPPDPSDDILFEEVDDDANPKDVVKKLRERLAVAVKEKQEYLDGWQRLRADFLNYKKRTEESHGGAKQEGKAELMEDLLQAVESFDMAMANTEAWGKVEKNWRVGVEYIYQQLVGALKDHGLEAIEPKKGEAFDPQLHQGVESVHTDEENMDHTIAAVVQKGYMVDGVVLRHPKVAVYAKEP